MEDQRWQGRLLWTRREDDQLSKKGCLVWLSMWACAPTHSMQGLWNFIRSSYHPEFMRLIRPVPHTKLTPSAECAVRYQKALLTFWRNVHRWRWLSTWTSIMLHERCCYLKCWGTSKLADSVPPWYSRVEPKRLYESENAQAYWDVPVYASLASGFVTAVLRLNRSLSRGCSCGSTSTLVQTLPIIEVSGLRTPSCVCATKAFS